MKKIFLLLVILYIVAACNNNVVEEQNTAKNSELLKIINRTDNQDDPITEQELIDLDLYSKFKIITYISGAVMQRNQIARNQVEASLQNNNTILMSDLLFSHGFEAFSCEYKFIFYNLLEMGKPLDPSGELEFEGIIGGRCSQIKKMDELDIFISEFHDNCFELFFPVDINIIHRSMQSTIYGIPHPLVENPFSQTELPVGEAINLEINGIVAMEYIDIEANFLDTHTRNVFVTRLQTLSRGCDYGEFSSTFFESFLNTD